MATSAFPAKQRTLAPVRKVGVSGVTGAASALIVYFLEQTGHPVPGYVAAALTSVLSFVFAWMTPSGNF